MEVVASLSQGRTAAARCGLFTHKSVPVIFEPRCTCGICGGRSGTWDGVMQGTSAYTKRHSTMFHSHLPSRDGKTAASEDAVLTACGAAFPPLTALRNTRTINPTGSLATYNDLTKALLNAIPPCPEGPFKPLFPKILPWQQSVYICCFSTVSTKLN